MLFTGFTFTTAITDGAGALYYVLYTSVSTIIIVVLDKNLNRRSLLAYTQLYGESQFFAMEQHVTKSG